jgi:hypothetical protein
MACRPGSFSSVPRTGSQYRFVYESQCVDGELRCLERVLPIAGSVPGERFWSQIAEVKEYLLSLVPFSLGHCQEVIT